MIRTRLRALAAPLTTALVTLAVAGAIYIGTKAPRTASGAETAATPASTPPTASPTPEPSTSATAEPDQHATPSPTRSATSGDGPFGSWRTTGGSHVALTFDDGPDPEHTPRVLALLREHGVKATFCLVGVNAQAYPDLVRAIAADGHTLCNHSWNHDFNLGGRSRAAIRADLARTNEAIRKAVPDARIAYFRQPGGYWTKSVVTVARELGMISLHWDVDPQDWRRPGARSIAKQVTTATAAGSIVLLHDGGGDRRGTVEALHTILPNLTRRFDVAALPAGDASH